MISITQTKITDRLANDQRPFRLFIDVDCGMHRTGIAIGVELERLRNWIETQPGVQFAGLHVYDGHIHDASLAARREQANLVIDAIKKYVNDRGVPAVIGGGSPTFGCWASETTWQCSPGTTLLWDVGYGRSYPDLEFWISAALLTRVISKPTCDLVCLDLGYKAVASEMPLEQRVTLPELPDAQLVGHSEEHLVVRTSNAAGLSIGDSLLAFPQHICPTVALHAYATVIRDSEATDETWRVTARDR